MMNKFFILGVGLIAALVFIFYKECTPWGDKNAVTMHRLLKDEKPNGKRVIITTQMSKAEVDYAIDGFIKLNAENDSFVERPLVKQIDGNTFRIIFLNNTTYDLFCYWVNYFVYSNKEKKYNNNVTGWYEVGTEPKGLWIPFANQMLMFYIPKSDTEYDNVYITTETNICYKQEFAWKASLIQQKTVYRKYVNMPYSETKK